MKIVCKQDSLLRGIKNASKAAISATNMPMLGCVLLKATTTRFKITSNNLDLGIESEIEDISIIEEGSIVIDAKVLLKSIKQLPLGNISISSKENNRVLIRHLISGIEYEIQGEAEKEFKYLPVIEKNIKYIIQQCKLKDMIKQTLFSVSTDESKFIFTGVLLEIKNNFINLVSTDGFRISFRSNPLLNISKQEASVIVHKKVLKTLSQILLAKDKHKVSIYITDKYILFDLGDTTVVSKVIDGDFINYEEVFTNDYTTKVSVNKSYLMANLEIALLLLKDSKNPVKIRIADNKIIIIVEIPFGIAEDKIIFENQSYKIDADVEGKDIEIAFNPKYIIDALKAIGDKRINLYFISSLSPCTIKPIEGNGYRYLILPVKLKED